MVSPLKIAWDTALVASIVYTVWRGGRDERLLSIIFFVASVATSQLLTGAHWLPTKTGAVMIGVLVALSFGAVAMVSNRWWPLWATSFQIISTVSLMAADIDRFTRPPAAYFGTVTWDYLTLLTMVVGVRIECRSRTLGAA